MSLQFVMGPSGSGKSHYLYQMITEESLKNPNKNYLVIVPEQFTLQTQKDLVMASPRKGILNVDVLSFNRLAHRVFEETGANQSIILDDVGKSFVLRKIAGNYEKKLKTLGNTMKRPGFISEMKSVISEFTQYNIQKEDLEKMIEKAGDATSLGRKLQDLSMIYEGFGAYLRGKYITGEELLDVLCVAVPKSNILKDSVVVLDGFTGFTPIQEKLLRELLLVCEKVIVTITMDSANRNLALFDMSRKMEESLIKRAQECRVTIEKPVRFDEYPVYRFRDNSALGFLEANLFRYSGKRYDKEQECIRVFQAETPKTELDFVAQSIRKMVRTEGLHYRDVAVIVSDMNTYANYVERIFDSYDIPIFMDQKRSVLLNSFVEYIRSLLGMLNQKFSGESVFRYLRTELAGLTRDEVDVLENYCVAMGIRGYTTWQKKWIRRTKGMTVSDLNAVNEYRERFVQTIDTIVSGLQGKAMTAQEITRALYDFLCENEMQQRVHEYEEKFAAEGEAVLAKEYAQVYRIVMDLFDKFVELLGDEVIDLEEYCELLDAGLEEAKVGVVPPSLDQVVIGDIERTRIKDIKALFFVGMNDSHIPGNADKGGLLSDYDREKLADSSVTLAPGIKEKSFIQKFYLYLLLTKPTEKLVLTYCQVSPGGKSELPAYLIADLMKLYPKLKKQTVEMKLDEKELTPSSAITYLAENLNQRDTAPQGEWEELYTWYKKNPKYSRILERILEACFYEKRSSSVSKEAAKKLYGDDLQNSVTKLEKFASCAYAYFLQYGLHLEEREEYQLDKRDWGNLFHSAIEKFSVKMKKAGYKWTDSNLDAERETFITESVKESVVDYANSILDSSARNEYTITRLERLVRRSVWAITKHLEQEKFEPDTFEEIYHSGALDLNDGNTMHVNGKIDRVDICETKDEVHVKIIDYKSNKKDIDLTKLYYGLQIQLILYMNAMIEKEKEKHPNKKVTPAGMFYYAALDPVIEKQPSETKRVEGLLKALEPAGIVNQEGILSDGSDGLKEEEMQVLFDYAKSKIVKLGNEIMAGNTEINPYKDRDHTSCTFCPYKGVCGFDERISDYHYRRLSKFEDAEIIDKMREEV